MGRMPVPLRLAPFHTRRCRLVWPWGITRRFHRLSPGRGLVAYALRTRAPLSRSRRASPVRLACIRPAASVHPEPGSNSSLYYCCTFYFFLFRAPLLVPFLTLETAGLTAPVSDFFAGLKLSKNCPKISPQKSFPLLIWDGKYTAFFLLRNFFSNFFSKIGEGRKSRF